MNKLLKTLAITAIIATTVTAQLGTSIEVVLVEAGSFTTMDGMQIGYTNGVEVTLTQDFWIGKYPVTQAQYQAVMGNNPSVLSGRPNNPVECVNWNEAVAFATAVGGRLPTEAQWEFAARGGNLSKGFIYSGSNNLNEVGWFLNNIPSQSFGNPDYGTQPVGQKLPNELGIYDMSGNVWEWTADWHQSTYPSSSTNPTGALTGSFRVLRGGGWGSNFASDCRVATRNGRSPSGLGSNFGFRVAFNSHSFELKKIRYEKNNGLTAYVVGVVGDATTITPPPIPTKDGYAFAGWYKNAELTEEWNFALDIVENDITLYAKWIKLFIVSFNTNGGNSISQIIDIFPGSTITRPNNPIKEDYAFAGWYKDEKLTEEWNFALDIVENDITLYAKWGESVTVSFNTNGGNSISPINNILLGSTITRPISPTKEGYVFTGWYKNTELTEVWNFATDRVPSDITLYAKWYAIRLGTSIEVVLLEAGSFSTTGGAVHNVTLTQDSWIGKYPVTQAQYQAVMGNNPSVFSGRPNNPVERVNFNEARAFATAVGGGLPSEARWEFAARGGNLSKRFIYSGSNDIDEVAWYLNNIPSQNYSSPDYGTQPVGQKLPNELGIYDMSGNVWEWTGDLWQSTYPSSSTDPWGGVTGSSRVIRGGCWGNDAEYCRVATRYSASQDLRGSIGFRVTFGLSIELKKIRYEKNNGSAAYVVGVVGDATTITPPPVPIFDEHIFVGWYKDAKFTEEWDFDFDVISTDTTLFAKWECFSGIHDYGELEVIEAATCTEDGYKARVCARCGDETDIEPIAKLGHDLSDVAKIAATCTAAGKEAGQECSRCEHTTGFAVIPQLTGEECDGATSIKSGTSDSRYGVKLAQNPVSDKAEISVILPNNEKAVETKIVIYDMTGNVVWAVTAHRDPTVWDLRNPAGRFVANGTYLVVVEAVGLSRKRYRYSARLGVKR